ncbi:MAG: prolipoprotein diacylglyceryl transferase [Ignavibacteriaceae bacterium]
MIPELFKIGPLTVYSYGLMLGIAFIVGSYILSYEFKRKKLPDYFNSEVTLLAIIFGIVGAKLFHLFENWDQFLENPVEMAFSPGGLTFYGGLIIATLSVYIYARIKKVPFLFVTDSAAPALALSYGIGRIGCHLSGDGDYGIPTSLPWGTNYENGVVKPSVMFRGSEIEQQFGGFVPDNTPLHPTPIYEFIVAAIIFYILWHYRKSLWSDGRIFMLYLILSGIARFLVEFIRLNPPLLYGLSEAQVISIGLIILGSAATFYYIMHPELPRFVVPESLTNSKKKNK